MNRKDGLLFALYGETGFRAKWAAGEPEPHYQEGVSLAAKGRLGGEAFRCDGARLRFSYLAPGNIYAARGTLCFSFCPVYSVGETPFPIFRVGYADHTSWDGVFLRIDYNGSGLDAFVTDTGLSRVRVSTQNEEILPQQWTHVAFAWDETIGVRLYVNGKRRAYKNACCHLDAALDQFGPYSRLISYWNVQSMFNFIRGGDIDEVLIFDHMLEDAEIEQIYATGQIPVNSASEAGVSSPGIGWLMRNGWNTPSAVPKTLDAAVTRVKKVEIHEAYDGPKWFWKACDGIRETTWPGVFNRSRLEGRTDYFLLPDWDCYSTSGQEIRFLMPDEPWNHVEITGAAYGWLQGDGFRLRKEQGLERASYRLDNMRRGGELIFTNDAQEKPISELSVYAVTQHGALPKKADATFSFGFGASQDAFAARTACEIAQRHPKGERRVLTAGIQQGEAAGQHLPCAHFIIPSELLSGEALSAVVLTLPPFKGRALIGGGIAMNVQVHDPLWTDRVMCDYSFVLPEGEERTLLLELRKRILRPEDGLYLTLQTSAQDMDSEYLQKLRIGVCFATAEEAKPEHIADRFVQIRDIYSHMVEERPGSPKLRLFRRFYADISDLLRIQPDHELAQRYLYDSLSTCNAQIQGVKKPAFQQTPLDAKVPAWVQRQLEYMGYVKRFLSWWIDKRQIANGEFGGGLSDDGDLTSWWPGPALCGIMRDKVTKSLILEMDAFLEQGMLTNGLSTIQTDEMHVFEEGLTVLGQCLIADEGNPRWLELAMENAQAIERISAFNCAGHRHFMTNYFSGTTMSREDPWQTSTGNSYLVCHPLYMLARMNREPRLIKLIAELADGILAHWKDGEMHIDVRFDDDSDACGESDKWYWALAAAYRLTGEERYLEPIRGKVRLCKPEGTDGTDEQLAEKYEALIEAAALREYINTDAHLWVDRVVLDIEQLQLDRLGGVAHQRFQVYPAHYLSWRFEKDEHAEAVAILTPQAQPDHIQIRAYNTLPYAVKADAMLMEIHAGDWLVCDGVHTQEKRLGHASHLTMEFAPGCETRYELTCIRSSPAELLPELGISDKDVKEEAACIRVKVHSLGAAPTEPCFAVLLDKQGNEISRCAIPSLEAPCALRPVTYDVILPCPWHREKQGWQIVIDPQHRNAEITRDNNSYTFS